MFLDTCISLFMDLMPKLFELPLGVLKTQQHFHFLLHICHLVVSVGNCRFTPSLVGGRRHLSLFFKTNLQWWKAQTVGNIQQGWIGLLYIVVVCTHVQLEETTLKGGKPQRKSYIAISQQMLSHYPYTQAHALLSEIKGILKATFKCKTNH